MSLLVSLVDKIGMANTLNLVLVNEDIRPAMLIQPADYGEATEKGFKTQSILQAIQETFPHLKQSHLYDIYQGILISKKDYNGQKDITLERMGQILGYPCYLEFNSLNRDQTYYSIEVVVLKHTVQLFANLCQDTTKYIDAFHQFAEKATSALNNDRYKELYGLNMPIKVDIEVYEIIPTEMIINKLIENRHCLEPKEIDKVQNILYNFGFSIELQLYFLNDFQYHNPVHKGILLGLLVKEKHDTLVPFFPLQNYPRQQKEVEYITNGLEKNILDVLEKTKITSLSFQNQY